MLIFSQVTTASLFRVVSFDRQDVAILQTSPERSARVRDSENQVELVDVLAKENVTQSLTDSP